MYDANTPASRYTTLQDLIESHHKWGEQYICGIQNELSFDAIHTSRFVAFQPLQGCIDLFTCDVSIQWVSVADLWPASASTTGFTAR